MKKIFISLLILVSQLATAADRDSIPPRQEDVGSLDAIIHALYQVISGPAGETRNWDRMRTLFTAEARLIATGKKQDGSMGRRVMTLEEYIATAGPYLEKEGFFEKEIARTKDEYGSVVHIFSSYESRKRADDQQPFARGINSIQLWNDGKRWWILSVFWQAETADNPIPEKYLKSN